MAENKNINVMHDRNIQQVSAVSKAVRICVKIGTYAFLLIMALIVLFPF